MTTAVAERDSANARSVARSAGDEEQFQRPPRQGDRIDQDERADGGARAEAVLVNVKPVPRSSPRCRTHDADTWQEHGDQHAANSGQCVDEAEDDDDLAQVEPDGEVEPHEPGADDGDGRRERLRRD